MYARISCIIGKYDIIPRFSPRYFNYSEIRFNEKINGREVGCDESEEKMLHLGTNSKFRN